jgi:hypothetical protein
MKEKNGMEMAVQKIHKSALSCFEIFSLAARLGHVRGHQHSFFNKRNKDSPDG